MTAEPMKRKRLPKPRQKKRRTTGRDYAPCVGKNVTDGAKERKEQQKRNERRRQRTKEKKRRLNTLPEPMLQVESRIILRKFLTRGPKHNKRLKKVCNKEQEKGAKKIGTQDITTVVKMVDLMTEVQSSRTIVLMPLAIAAAIIIAIWLNKGKIFALLAGANAAADVSD